MLKDCRFNPWNMEQNRYFTFIPLIHHAVVGVLSSEMKQEHRQGDLEETEGNRSISLLHRRHETAVKSQESVTWLLEPIYEFIRVI